MIEEKVTPISHRKLIILMQDNHRVYFHALLKLGAENI